MINRFWGLLGDYYVNLILVKYERNSLSIRKKEMLTDNEIQ